MSREEAMNALIESGMDLRRDDIELGRKLERERIMKALEPLRPPAACRCESCATAHKFFQLIEAKND